MKYLLILFIATSAQAQVSIFTSPASKTIVFENRTSTYTVTPKPGAPATTVTIPSGFGQSSTFRVSPQGIPTRIFTVDKK